MRSRSTLPMERYLLFGEGLALLVAAPLLMFPTVYVPATMAVLALLIMLWVFQWIFAGRTLLPWTPLTLALALWLVMILVGVAVSADPDLSAVKASNLLLGAAVWRFLVMSVRSQLTLRISLLIFFLVVVAMMLVGVLSAEWVVDVPVVGPVIQQLPAQLLRLPEAPTAGIHTNELAGLIVTAIPLAVALLLGRRAISANRLVWPALIALVLALFGTLVLTQSRTGWLAAASSLVVLSFMWAVVSPRSRARTVVWLGLGVVCALILATLLAVGPDQLLSIWEEPPENTPIGTITTIRTRQELWGWATTAIEDFPVTGVGLGSFRRAAHRLYPVPIPRTNDFAHVHNIILQVALDTGLPGLIAYLAVVGLALFITMKVARSAPECRWLAIGLGASLLAYHLFGVADAIAPGAKPGILFWFLLGLACALYPLALPEKRLAR